MDQIHYGKWAAWIGINLNLLVVNVIAQPGFLSINCGAGEENLMAQNGITWVGDANYIDVGNTTEITPVSPSDYATEKDYGTYLRTIRVFPKPLNKCCYQLPVVPDVPYLLRLWFTLGNYSGFQQLPSFAFSIETLGLLASENVSSTDTDIQFYEYVLVSSGSVLYVCLIRTSDTDDPFINAIELRNLTVGMYAPAQPGTLLGFLERANVGGSTLIRYPEDNFDRLWRIQPPPEENNLVVTVTTTHPISSNTTTTDDFPPAAVMQTAWVVKGDAIHFSFGSSSYPIYGKKTLVKLYFADIVTSDPSDSRSFNVIINGDPQPKIISFEHKYTTIERSYPYNAYSTHNFTFAVLKAPDTTLGPVINAFEYYWVTDTHPQTNMQDVEALDAIKSKFEMKYWISDPCYLIEWEGTRCGPSSSDRRITELNLSGRNQRGSIPEDIGRLTALVHLSLNNNLLTGPLPDFSSLAMLERLYLQNNNLSGSVPEWLSELGNLAELSLANNHLIGSLPDLSSLTKLERLYLHNNKLNGTLPKWLSELKNLKELNIENNNFSGVIPAPLLHNCSLKLNYSGNIYLRREERKCTSQKNGFQTSRLQSNNLKVVLGTTLSGFLIIGLIVGVVVYCNKFKGKEEIALNESNRVEKERKHFLEQDYSRIKVPNPTNCRAFTLDEMTAATETFSEEIGRGGFGSVFFGKLPDGKQIAVKVLSLFSHQGVDEFLNEVDLLSRINHRNLVSLLGYCNETREVMLIYEHMSKGSLRDHLYGPRAENCEVAWKTRLKIALDAAQGLEYLHVGCTPKIIHRDVKTANILLDGNLTGKLADFGLSRMTVNGQATHVTTVVKGTFGYLDPEYYSTQMLTEKSDVYSFGVVLLEIICGRPPIDLKLAEEDVNIIRWATPYILDDDVAKIRKIIDKRLDGSYDMKSMTSVAKVAMRCVQVERSFRPSMSELVAEIKEAVKLEDIASVSVSEEIAIEGGDLVAGGAESSKREGMEWCDNSSNIPLVGR